ncbi:MAG: hypothetical protein VX990_02375 [Pseudomonadota bacterium]|nr:hypothetical protein [Pseudomonadota bacterium]
MGSNSPAWIATTAIIMLNCVLLVVGVKEKALVINVPRRLRGSA